METTQVPEIAIETKNLFIFYGSFAAVSEVTIKIEQSSVHRDAENPRCCAPSTA
jgi:ABC-type phosphate transport system ATPase subunit